MPFIIQSWEKHKILTPNHVFFWQTDFSDNLYLKLNGTQYVSQGGISVMEMNDPFSIVAIIIAH